MRSAYHISRQRKSEKTDRGERKSSEEMRRTMKRMLIVVYSWSNGNTRKIAELLQEKTGADLAAIDTVTPYPADYNTTVTQGQREVETGFLPKIRPLEKNVRDYDVIALGTPTWWYTMAPAVRTFLSEQDLSGKILIPFITNGGWPGHALKDLKEGAKGAESMLGLQVRFDSTGGDRMETPRREVENWAEKVRAFLES
jgi:flavodoxin